ncbi:MAG TPA: cytochrome bc complex cytochrome b subunit [Gemmatimonadota bacterium]|jgi:cytochrome b6
MPDREELRRRLGKAEVWLDERVGLTDARRIARKKEIPLHRHTVWYYLGGMTLFLFTIQVLTGVLLLFYYRPSSEEAYESVRFLMAEVKFGWLVRSIHAWSANLMIFTAFLHLFSVLLLKAYRKPRELTWISGAILMALALGFGFTGYLLPWNELAFFATRVGTEIVGVLPVVGSFALRILRGGDNVTGATLTRFYAVHVAVLPALTTFFLGLHLYLVQRHGMSSPVDADAAGSRRAMPFFPNFLMRDFVGWLAALAVLAALAAYFPIELGKEADPFAPAPAGIKPEWYFMFMFQTLKYLPAHVLWIIEGELLGILAFMVLGVFLLLVPIYDPEGRGKRSRIVTRVGIGLIVYMIILTVVGYLANPTQ